MEGENRPVREGMRVFSVDGHFLGRVEGVGDTHFLIERGWLIPHEYLADYGDIRNTERSDVYLTRKLADLEEQHEESYRGRDLSPEPVNEPGS